MHEVTGRYKLVTVKTQSKHSHTVPKSSHLRTARHLAMTLEKLTLSTSDNSSNTYAICCETYYLELCVYIYIYIHIYFSIFYVNSKKSLIVFLTPCLGTSRKNEVGWACTVYGETRGAHGLLLGETGVKRSL
jgi:hypothetical protein